MKVVSNGSSRLITPLLERGPELFGPTSEAYEVALREHQWLRQYYKILQNVERVEDGTVIAESLDRQRGEALRWLLEEADRMGIKVRLDSSLNDSRYGGSTLRYPDERIVIKMPSRVDYPEEWLGALVHEFIHGEDLVVGRYNPLDIFSVARTESKAYAHTAGYLYEEKWKYFWGSLRFRLNAIYRRNR